MKITVCPAADDVALTVGEIICAAAVKKPDLVLAVPGDIFNFPWFFITVAHLTGCMLREEVSFRRARIFATHEFLGTGFNNPASNGRNLWLRILKPLEAQPRLITLFDGATPDPEYECLQYESVIRTVGGIDLLLLTMGIRGEVASNEPTSSLGSRCRVKTLHPDELVGDSRFSRIPKPRHALTMGVATLMEARKAVIIATGFNRASAVARALDGPVTSTVPVSIFQRHSDCHVILDRAASRYSRVCQETTSQ